MQTDKKAPTQAQGQGAERPDMQRDDGWKTAGPKIKNGAPQARQAAAQGQQRPSGGKAATQRNSKLSPSRLKNGSQQRSGPNKAAAKQLSGADPGDGSVIFDQLCYYLNTRASQAYVAHTAMRLSDLAKERRFGAFEKALPEAERNGKTTQELRESWSDTAPEYRQDKYGGPNSVWRLHIHEHQGRLYQLLIKWVVNEQVKQRELEDRLQFFKFETTPEHMQPMVDEPTLLRGSYREAVGPAERTRTTPTPSTEQERLTALCLQPAELLTQLRERTEDEVKAIVMILNHEIEVPNVPPFLIQSMDPSELACFEDIFMALEYPLYAHLAPGQRFFANMTKGAILAQIYVGVEAARKL
ncbi:hypothetical protein PR003_g29349 [Phytophthora rubi]|uniref:Uncharacterized protein n=1 Tax=Phytophthora rubi TaxID=129364 RepID=A0A6A3HAP1_9STRA|nr:hypothetical protein PR002_g28249 [Phytophthora rubi]KAE9275386.1 hypothetical protein PR003_g29349 [Phytophthora rubi]